MNGQESFVRLEGEVNIPEEGDPLNENNAIGQGHKVEVGQLS